MTYRAAKKYLESADYVIVRQNGSHVTFRHKVTGQTVTVPNHSGKDLSPGVMADLKRKTGLSFR